MAGWITVKGTHVYVEDGESVEEAFARTTGSTLEKENNKTVNENLRNAKASSSEKKAQAMDKLNKNERIVNKIGNILKNNENLQFEDQAEILNLLNKSTNGSLKAAVINKFLESENENLHHLMGALDKETFKKVDKETRKQINDVEKGIEENDFNKILEAGQQAIMFYNFAVQKAIEERSIKPTTYNYQNAAQAIDDFENELNDMGLYEHRYTLLKEARRGEANLRAVAKISGGWMKQLSDSDISKLAAIAKYTK